MRGIINISWFCRTALIILSATYAGSRKGSTCGHLKKKIFIATIQIALESHFIQKMSQIYSYSMKKRSKYHKSYERQNLHYVRVSGHCCFSPV